jgi:hypothetical protein
MIDRSHRLVRPTQTEHDFTGSREEWEQRVFLNAAYFRVHRFLSQGEHESTQTEDFVEALRLAGHEMLRKRRALIYAVTESGRYVCLPQKQWRHLYELWNATKRGLSGQPDKL